MAVDCSTRVYAWEADYWNRVDDAVGEMASETETSSTFDYGAEVESGIWSQMGYVRDALICPLAVGNEIGIPRMRGCDHVSWVLGSVIEKGRMSRSACS